MTTMKHIAHKCGARTRVSSVNAGAPHIEHFDLTIDRIFQMCGDVFFLYGMLDRRRAYLFKFISHLNLGREE